MTGHSNEHASSRRSAFVEVPAPYRSMASWVAGLREGEPHAVRAFYELYAPLLRDQARRMGVLPDDRSDMVTTVLGDVLLHIQECDLPPRDLARYVVAAMRNRARNAHRDQERRSAREERAYTSSAAGGQRVVAECHSSYGIRSASAPGSDTAPELTHAIEKLAAYSAQALAPDDAVLMVGMSHNVPLRDLAAQMGISYGAARVRVHRLRERFLKLARQYVASLAEAERQEMERFFRRAGVALHDDERPARPPQPRGRPMPDRRDGETT